MEEKLIIKTEEGPFVIGCVIWEIALFIWLWMEGNKRVNAEGRLPNMTENIVVMLLIVVCIYIMIIFFDDVCQENGINKERLCDIHSFYKKVLFLGGIPDKETGTVS